MDGRSDRFGKRDDNCSEAEKKKIFAQNQFIRLTQLRFRCTVMYGVSRICDIPLSDLVYKCKRCAVFCQLRYPGNNRPLCLCGWPLLLSQRFEFIVVFTFAAAGKSPLFRFVFQEM
ncbi:hypothetical protein CDAR_114491 [Caerostris darwini]|uniref:Uncharacterized protein n=1 Tax=Caerostris darwini TaxID=1538125 RepID=A0AAV4R1N4_9ARAC|nr:hypothetical protein CDAR_114491 [Caerostris darwini]